VEDYKLDKLYSYESIRKRVSALADDLNEFEYSLFNSPCPVFIGVMNGAFMFMTDLIRKLEFPITTDFIRVMSYRGTKRCDMYLEYEPKVQLSNQDIVLIEDIIDSGNTINFLYNYFTKTQEVRSCMILSLLERKPVDVPMHKSLYRLDTDKFVVGYGLDYNDELRHLPDIYTLEVEDDK